MDNQANHRLTIRNNLSHFSITPDILLGYGILEHTFSRIAGFLFYSLSGRAIFGQWFCLGIWIVLLFLYLGKNIKKRIAFSIISSVLLIVLFLFFMYVFFPATSLFYNEYYTDLLMVVFLGVPCAVLLSKKESLNDLSISILPLLRFGTILAIGALILGMKRSFVGDMGWGMTAMPLSIFYYGYLRVSRRRKLHQKRIDKILGRVAVFLSFIGGRQWLVIILLAILFCSIWEADSHRKRIVFVLSGAVLVVLVFIFYDSFVTLLSSLLARTAISSRALESIASGRLLDAYNRNSIYSLCQTIIRENGAKVSGLFADRLYLRAYRSSIAYAHNLFFEILIDFGTILGGLIILLFIFTLERNYFRCQKEQRVMYVLFICYGLLRYFVSSSILIEPTFTILLGVVLNRKISKANTAGEIYAYECQHH